MDHTARNETRGHRIRGRLLLLFLMLPLIGCATALVVLVQEPDGFVEMNEDHATWRDYRWGEFKCFRFSFESRSLVEVDEFRHQESPTNAYGELLCVSENPRLYPVRKIKTTVHAVDSQTFKPKRSIEFPDYPRFVANQFAVAVFENTLYSCDLNQPILEIQTLSIGRQANGLKAIDDTNRFWTITTTQTQTNPSLSFLEVYEIDDKATVSLVLSIPVLPNAVNIEKGVIKLVTTDGTTYEERDSETGALLRALPLPEKFVKASTVAAVREMFIIFDDGTRYICYEPVRDYTIHLTGSKAVVAFTTKPEFGLMVVGELMPPSSKMKLSVFDVQSGKKLSEIWPHPLAKHFVTAELVDRNTLVVRNAFSGLTFEFYDIRSQTLVHRIAPFRWASWGLPVLIVLFGLWTVAWLRMSTSEGGWAWVDICFLATLLLVPLLGRLLFIHVPTDISRLPFNYAQGILVGLFNISALWLAMGKSRLTLRVTPFLGCIALTMSLIRIFFAPFTREAWLGIGGTILPAFIMVAIYVMSRWLGWRFFNVGSGGAGEGPKADRGIPIRDYFLLTACLAIVAMVSREMMPSFYMWFQYPTEYTVLAMATAFLTLSTFTALGEVRKSSPVANCSLILCKLAVSLCTVVLIAYPVARFAFDFSIHPAVQFAVPVFLVIGSGVVSTFVFLQAYRLRGWRLGNARWSQHSVYERGDTLDAAQGSAFLRCE